MGGRVDLKMVGVTSFVLLFYENEKFININLL